MRDDVREALRWGAMAGSRYVMGIPRHAGLGGSGSLAGLGPGRSIEFRDYRSYFPGDDPRLVDWNVFARSDKLVVKLHQEEIQPRFDILLDSSRSMAKNRNPTFAPGSNSTRTSTSLSGRKSSRKIEPNSANRRMP